MYFLTFFQKNFLFFLRALVFDFFWCHCGAMTVDVPSTGATSPLLWTVRIITTSPSTPCPASEFKSFFRIIGAPQIWGGTFCPGGTFASIWLKLSQKLANFLLYTKNNNLNQKYIKRMTLGLQNVGKRPFSETYLFLNFWGHQFWSPRTSPDSFRFNK